MILDIKVNKYYIVFTIFLIIFSGCSKKVYQPVSTNSPQVLDEYNEDLSKFIPVYSYEEKKTILKPPTTNYTTKITSNPKSDNNLVEAKLKALSINNNQASSQTGYRLLIYSGNEKEEFEQAKTYILANYPNLEIYESYKQPTYKIKVGDFTSKLESQKYYGLLVNRFTTTTIIIDKINIQKSLNN